MRKEMWNWLAAGLLVVTLFARSEARAICSYTYMFSSGTNAVASQVNQDLNDIVNCALPASGGTFSNGTLAGTTNLPGSGVINSTGNVGIGTASPGAKLDVNGAISSNRNWYYLAGAGDTNHAIGNIVASDGEQFRFFNFLDLYQTTGGASRLYINSSGSIGIGTTTPGSDVNMTGGLTINGTGSSQFTVQQGGSSGFALNIGHVRQASVDSGCS